MTIEIGAEFPIGIKDPIFADYADFADRFHQVIGHVPPDPDQLKDDAVASAT